MRIWTVHPKYLDVKGFVADWRETLLAQAVLRGKTKGWTNHPQLDRFKAHSDPVAAVATYLDYLQKHATERGYKFDKSKIVPQRTKTKIKVSREFLKQEWRDLLGKLKVRDQERYKKYKNVKEQDLHPSFELI